MNFTCDLSINNLHYLKWNVYISIQENSIENVVWEMAAISSRP